MNRLSDNYYLRKCYLERYQVPTQSVMKEKMTEPLANIYFNSMTVRQKVYAGLEPPMKGGGTEWYMPPEELLAGRAVLKPVKAEHIKKLSAQIIRIVGEQSKNDHYQDMINEIDQTILKNDNDWKAKITASNAQQYAKWGEVEAKNNTRMLLGTLNDFETLYRRSVTNIEETIMSAAQKEITRIQDEAYEYMKRRLVQLMKHQSITLQNEYENELNKKKDELKQLFMIKVQNIRSETAKMVHDSNYEKHLAVEKLRHFLECKNLACQVYVAVKEKEECEKELQQSKRQHKKAKDALDLEVTIKNIEIQKERKQQEKCKEFNEIWKNKICHVVKMFQSFVEYCLRELPDYADFFLNVEKLMLLQLSEAYESPDHESSITTSEPDISLKAPEPRPRPFYLFCDTKSKLDINSNLCPNRVASSASQCPVIVINKRCIYSACDNLELFSKKVSQYIYGGVRDDNDFIDDENYDSKVPIKYSSLMQLLELKLESSLMQVLQKELPNTRNLPLNCTYCHLPFCICTNYNLKNSINFSTSPQESKETTTISSPNLNPMSAKTEMELRREPKWKSYSDFVSSNKCKCSRTAKKQLIHSLPAYMKNMSPYAPPELPYYETCDIETLKILVSRAHMTPRPQVVENLLHFPIDASTQCSDPMFDNLCTCFSDDELSKFLKNLLKGLDPHSEYRKTELNVDISGSSLKSASTFATARARSLRGLIETDSELKEIFRKSTCD